MTDKFVFGNTMKSTAGKVLWGERQVDDLVFRDPRIGVSEIIPVHLDSETMDTLQAVHEEMCVFNEAVEQVAHMSPEELQATEQLELYQLAGNHSVRGILQHLIIPEVPEPEIRGKTTMGLSVAWLDWYMNTFKVKAWVAIKEGKLRLRAMKAQPKRKKKRSINPK